MACIEFLCFQPQYVFIHDALLESIMCGDNSIKAPELKAKVKELQGVVPESGKTMFETQFAVSVADVGLRTGVSVGEGVLRVCCECCYRTGVSMGEGVFCRTGVSVGEGMLGVSVGEDVLRVLGVRV